MIKKGFLALLLILNISIKAYEVDDFLPNENLNSFLTRNIKRYKNKYGSDLNAFLNDIKKWNPHVVDWNNIKPGTALYTNYPYPSYILESSYSEAPKSNLHYSETDQVYSIFGFYTASVGNYSEKTDDQTVKSGQNFPITVGLATSITNKEKEHFITASTYWAKPTSGKISGNASSNSTISIPGEVGFNLYYQYFIKSQLVGLYGGYDFENLNTFNTDQLILGQNIENISNKMHYLTVGMGQSIQSGSTMVNAKLSVSKVVSSSTSGTKALTGQKFLLYISYRPEGRFSYNFLYKHHDLNGPTKLSINRIGLSLGFQFF